ncbi:hypothetical protein WI37_25530 [Burkholderia ubonensis]|nr:hypothetical protein WI37_25530 [Burkholderia ubonensis]
MPVPSEIQPRIPAADSLPVASRIIDATPVVRLTAPSVADATESAPLTVSAAMPPASAGAAAPSDAIVPSAPNAIPTPAINHFQKL